MTSKLKLHRIVDLHENIIRIFGVTKEEAGKYLEM